MINKFYSESSFFYKTIFSITYAHFYMFKFETILNIFIVPTFELFIR